jgi:dipeptidyl aminopeptidase/acylaminoacyl peptidase
MRRVFGNLPSEQRRADPVTFVSAGDPPMLLLQGTGDHEVATSGSESLMRKAQAAGDDAELKLYPGVGHMALLFALSRPLRQHANTLCDVLAFLRAHERPSAAVSATSPSRSGTCSECP